MDFHYEINDGTYEVYGHIKVPAPGPNIISAEIRKAGTNQVVTDSPYKVVAKATHDNAYNPFPEFEVTRRETVTVTDPKQQARILTDYLAEGGNLDFAPHKLVTDQVKDEVPVTKEYLNDTKDESPYVYDEAITNTVTTSIGVTAKAEIELAKFASVSVEGEWEHEVSTSVTQHVKAQIMLPPNHRGVFMQGAGYDEVTGDFTVYTSTKAYSLKNVSFQYPVAGKGTFHGVDLDKDKP